MPAHTVQRSPRMPLLRGGELDLLHMIAPVRRRLVVLGARLDPSHRPPELHRAERGDEVTLNLRNLAAEAAAHLGRDDPQAIFRHAGDDRQDEADDMRVLGRVPQRQLTGGRRKLRDRAARLSIAVGIRRCWMMRSRSTTGAELNAASTSPPATVQ